MYDSTEIQYAHVPYLRTKRYKPKLLNYSPTFTKADYVALRACGFTPISIRSIRNAQRQPLSPLQLATVNYTEEHNGTLHVAINSKLYARITCEPDDWYDNDDGAVELVHNPRTCPGPGGECIYYTDDELEHILGGYWRESSYHLHIPWENTRGMRSYWTSRGISRGDVEILVRAWIRTNLEEAYFYMRNYDERTQFTIGITIRDVETSEELGQSSLGGIDYDTSCSSDSIISTVMEYDLISEAINDMQATTRSRMARYPDLLDSLV